MVSALPKDKLREQQNFTDCSWTTEYNKAGNVCDGSFRLLSVRFLFAVHGSFGDINPCAGIGAGLRERGHDVVFLTSGYYQEWLAGLGIETVPTLSTEDHLRVTGQPDFSHPLRAYRLLWGLVLRAAKPEYEAILKRYDPGRTVVVARLLNVGPRIANERRGVPLLHLAVSPDELAPVRRPDALKRLVSEAAWKKLAAWIARRLDKRIAVNLNQLRRELDLPPVERWFSAANYRPQSIIGLFPSWYATPEPEWPQVQHAGFPLFDGGTNSQLTERLERFLAEGSAPIVITGFSATQSAREYFHTAVNAMEKMGARAVLLSSFRANIPAQLPASIGYFGYVPLGLLLPRSAAIVHHGGVGTVAAALRAGVPQLIVPQNFDNASHAERVSQMGVGWVLRRRQLGPERLAKEAQALLASLQIREKCSEYVAKIRDTDGIEAACRMIEDDSRQFTSLKSAAGFAPGTC
jgi:rhamnosyltransferase subunit B